MNPPWTKIPGWFDAADVEFVSEICHSLYGGWVIEIGFFAGRATSVMAPICIANECVYVAVDNCTGNEDTRDDATKMQQQQDVLSAFLVNMRRLYLLDKIMVVRGDSSQFAALVAHQHVAFCFVDGGHTEAVKGELASWWPRIRPLGILAGHDYANRNVYNAVQHLAETHRVEIIQDGSCWKIQKPDTSATKWQRLSRSEKVRLIEARQASGDRDE